MIYRHIDAHKSSLCISLASWWHHKGLGFYTVFIYRPLKSGTSARNQGRTWRQGSSVTGKTHIVGRVNLVQYSSSCHPSHPKRLRLLCKMCHFPSHLRHILLWASLRYCTDILSKEMWWKVPSILSKSACQLPLVSSYFVLFFLHHRSPQCASSVLPKIWNLKVIDRLVSCCVVFFQPFPCQVFLVDLDFGNTPSALLDQTQGPFNWKKNKQKKKHSHKEREKLIFSPRMHVRWGLEVRWSIDGDFNSSFGNTHARTCTRIYAHTERERESPLQVSSMSRISCVERMRVGITPGTQVATSCFRRNTACMAARLQRSRRFVYNRSNIAWNRAWAICFPFKKIHFGPMRETREPNWPRRQEARDIELLHFVTHIWTQTYSTGFVVGILMCVCAWHHLRVLLHTGFSKYVLLFNAVQTKSKTQIWFERTAVWACAVYRVELRMTCSLIQILII